MNKEHGQDIYENALDSIERAIDLIIYDYDLKKESILKQSIILLYHGIELLLKTRLMRIHPSLVWEDIDLYPKLEARTIGSEKSIKRLINIGGLNISEETIRTITQLRKIRNSIEHFSWTINQNTGEKLFAKSLFQIDLFCIEHLSFGIFSYKEHKEGKLDEVIKNNSFIKKCYENNKELLLLAGRKETNICYNCNAILPSKYGTCIKCGFITYEEDKIINDSSNSAPDFDDFDDDFPF